MSVISGLVGTLFSLWLYESFLDWLVIISSILPSIGGIIIADFLINRKYYSKINQDHYQPVINWASFIAFFTGVICAYFLPGIMPLNSLIASIMSYVICNSVFNQTTYLKESFDKREAFRQWLNPMHLDALLQH